MPESSLLNAIMNYGLETIVIAVLINMATTILKIPIKNLANKLEDGGKSIKKYITFLPIVLGFVFSAGYTFFFVSRTDIFTKDFIVLWLTSSSLSLATYAVFEKFFPNSNGENVFFTEDMMYRAYRLIESLSDIGDPKDLKTLAKLVYNKCIEFKESGVDDYHKLSDVLKGLIPDESLEAVSRAMFERIKGQLGNTNEDIPVSKSATNRQKSLKKIILKGNGN